MQNKIRMIAGCMAIVLLLSLTGGLPALAEDVPDTTKIPEIPVETQPAQTDPPEEPEETLPPAVTYTVDTESEIYRICDELAKNMESDQILVYDSTNDQILYTRSNEGQKLYPASVTKLFSAWVALQYLDPWEAVTVTDALDLVQPGSSIAYLGRWQQLYVRTVVEGMMLPSGNDAAMVLAVAAGRRIAQDENLGAAEALQVFVAEMNRKAKELGFERSHFSNPDGFHIGSHYTCLNDMARIAKLALDNSVIASYIRRYKDEVTFLSGHTITWENTNLFLNPEKGFYRGDALGMKTGYTRQAEYCLMSAFRCRDGRILVIGSFGCADEYARYREINALVNACQNYWAASGTQPTN